MRLGWFSALLAILALASAPAHATDRTVGKGARYATVTEALAAAQPGDRVLVRAGVYREPTLVVRTARVTVQGEGWAVLDGQGEREVLVIVADDVTCISAASSSLP